MSKGKDNIRRGKAFPLVTKTDNRLRKYTNQKDRDSHPKPEDLEIFRLVLTD